MMPTKKLITHNRYRKRIQQHQKSIDVIVRKLADETNQYIKSYPDRNPTRFQSRYYIEDLDHLIDNLALFAGWLKDRHDGRIATVHNKDYRGSLTKKIRKALGYTL